MQLNEQNFEQYLSHELIENHVSNMEELSEKIFSIKTIFSINREDYLDFFNKFALLKINLSKLYNDDIAKYELTNDFLTNFTKYINNYDLDTCFIKKIETTDDLNKLRLDTIEKVKKEGLILNASNKNIFSLKYSEPDNVQTELDENIEKEIELEKLIIFCDINMLWNKSEGAFDLTNELLYFLYNKKNINILNILLDIETNEYDI